MSASLVQDEEDHPQRLRRLEEAQHDVKAGMTTDGGSGVCKVGGSRLVAVEQLLEDGKASGRHLPLLPRVLVRPRIELEKDRVADKVKVRLEARGPRPGAQVERDGAVGEDVYEVEEGAGHGELLEAGLDVVEFRVEALALDA
jgi:hypothetical protein